MKRFPSIIALSLLAVLHITCQKFDFPPLTKVNTIDAKAEVISVQVDGVIVDLSGTANDDYGFCYSTTQNPTVEDAMVSAGSPKIGEFSVQIQNLTPGVQYYYRAYCKDGEGYAYGDALTFTTLDGVIGIASSQVIYVSPSSARIEVSIASDGGAPITSRGLCWSTSPNPTIENNTLSAGENKGDFIGSILELQPNTTYYARAFATNLLGTAYGEEHSFTTLDDATVRDIDGNTYPTVIINGTEWLAENLRVTKYNDGTAIPSGLNATSWEGTTEGAIAVYPHQDVDGISSENDMVTAYGVLYNWYAVADDKGLCPVGWRLPTDDEWTELTDYIATVNNQAIGNQLKSCFQVSSTLGGDCSTTTHPRWNADDSNYGTNDYGFTALPAGIRYLNGTFTNIGIQASFWSATGLGTSSAWYRNIFSNNESITRSVDDKKLGLSVRCVREWE